LFSTLNVGLSIPAFAFSLTFWGIESAILAWIATSAIMLCIGARILVKDLSGTYGPLIRSLVRPAIASAMMLASISVIVPAVHALHDWGTKAILLVALIALGAVVYAALIAFLWLTAGRPDGAERELLFVMSARLAKGTS
jgi:peptidoglycan biosynthesis protein MviN/MurJ (putative lipid II flippase)